MAKLHKYIVEVVITTTEPLLKKEVKKLVEDQIDDDVNVEKVRVRSVDYD